LKFILLYLALNFTCWL